MVAPIMAMLAVLMGAMGLIASLLVAIAPEAFLSMFAEIRSTQGLYFSAIGNLFWGVVLILAAPIAKYPLGFRILGALSLLAGLVTPFLPVDLWIAYVDWWTVDNVFLYRVVGAPLGALMGIFIVYGALPKDDEPHTDSST